MTRRTLSPRISGLIRRIVERDLNVSGIARIESSIGEDHDGDETVIIDVTYDSCEPDIDSERLAQIVLTLNNELYGAGEDRFAYIYDRPAGPDPGIGPV